MNVSELARQLAIPRSTVAQWFRKEKTRTLPSRQHLEKVSSYLDGLEGSPDEAPVAGEDAAANTKLRRHRPDPFRQAHQPAAQERAEKIKLLLILLESELRWFKDGSPEVRDTFRKRLDQYDVGYIASLLTMMGNEASFQRWLALTTNRFRFFGKGKK